MADTRELLERAAAAAPVSELDAVTLERRRAHRRRRERIAATVVGVGVGVALIVGAVTVAPGHGSPPRSGGAGLPPATTPPLVAATGEYYVQRVRETTACATSSCPGGDVGVDLTATIWWATDGSGRIDAPRHQNYGITQGTFAPGSFPTEGDTGAFPTDPASLQTYLLDRSAPGGASPGPGEPTPTPGVDARTGDVWRSIENLLSDPAAYGDTTPALRAALVEVAARLPMATVDTTAVDPAGRPAIRIRVAAFQGVTDLFVDPGSHDLLAAVDTYDDGWVESYVVLRAGIADSTDAMPTADQSSIPAASGS